MKILRWILLLLFYWFIAIALYFICSFLLNLTHQIGLIPYYIMAFIIFILAIYLPIILPTFVIKKLSLSPKLAGIILLISNIIGLVWAVISFNITVYEIEFNEIIDELTLLFLMFGIVGNIAVFYVSFKPKNAISN